MAVKSKSQLGAKKTPKKTVKSAKKTESDKTVEGTMQIPVYNMEATIEKNIDLNPEIFGVNASPRLIAQYVRVYLANQRQGSASTKTRGEIIGSTKKIYRQKGTGNARHGSKKAPTFVGGGVTFGPQPRDFSLRMNKKQKIRALCASLTLRAKDKAIVALSKEVLSMEPKTKNFAKLLKNLGMADKKMLVVVAKKEQSGMFLSARNIPSVLIVPAATLNPYEVLTHEQIIFVEDALEVLHSHHFKTNGN